MTAGIIGTGSNSAACKKFNAAQKLDHGGINWNGIANWTGKVSELSAAGALMFSGTPIGVAFAGVAVVAGGVSLTASAIGTVEHPTTDNKLNLAISAGLAAIGFQAMSEDAAYVREVGALAISIYWDIENYIHTGQ